MTKRGTQERSLGAVQKMADSVGGNTVDDAGLWGTGEGRLEGGFTWETWNTE